MITVLSCWKIRWVLVHIVTYRRPRTVLLWHLVTVFSHFWSICVLLTILCFFFSSSFFFILFCIKPSIWRTARLKRDGTRAETQSGLSAKRTSPFKLVGLSVQSTTGSRCVRISGSNAGYTMFWGRVLDYWLPTPLACFPFTSPAVRHRVPSGFNWALQLPFRVARHIIVTYRVSWFPPRAQQSAN